MKVQVIFSMMRMLLVCSMLLGFSNCGPSATPVPSTQDPTKAVTMPVPEPNETLTPWDGCEVYPHEIAYGSVTLNTPTDVSPLNHCDTFLTIVEDGFVTTNSTGEAKMVNGSCTLYLFQEGNVNIVSDVTVEMCEEGVSCAIQETDTCSKLTVIALGDIELTFLGTTATILADYSRYVTVIFASEGKVQATFKDGSSLVVEAGQAVYFSNQTVDETTRQLFGGIEPGQPVGFEELAKPVEILGFAPQIQRANLNLLRRDPGWPRIPISVPYMLGLRWMGEKYDNKLAAEGVAMIMDWRASVPALFPQAGLMFTTQGENLNVFDYAYDPGQATKQLSEAGLGGGLTLVFDGSIPGLSGLAEQMVKEMTNQGIAVTLQAVKPEQIDEVITAIENGGLSGLYLGGY